MQTTLITTLTEDNQELTKGIQAYKEQLNLVKIKAVEQEKQLVKLKKAFTANKNKLKKT